MRICPPATRRDFLGHLAKVALASPLIPLLDAHAQTGGAPRRIILFFTPQGTYQPDWRPVGNEAAFTLGPVMSPLVPLQKKINVINGLFMAQKNFVGHPAGGRQLWTGTETPLGPPDTRPDRVFEFQYGPTQGPSVDQYIAGALGSATAYPSLEFSVRTGQSVIYGGNNQIIYGASDPQEAFSRLFAQVPTETLRRRGSVLDVVGQEIASMQAMLAQSDRAKLDQHLTSVRSLENRLASQTTACGGPQDIKTSDDRDYLNSMMDLATSALACDLTRVVSLQFGQPDNDGDPYPFLNIYGSHHDLTHHGSDTYDIAGNIPSDPSGTVNGQLKTLYTWYSSMFAGLLSRLDAVPEGSGTMLDNTLVIWGSELADYVTHGYGPSMPFVTAGGSNLGVKNGRFLDYGDYGQPHNRLLVSACNAVGLSDVTTFGKTDPGSGPLPNF